jgi:wobble nucleotide-excising tRNase
MSEELEKKLDAELEEAKATGEDSESADAVTPEGGTDKKRKADKAAPAPKMEKVAETPAFETIFDGEELSEDFKTKAEAVFEAAVHEKATTIREELEEKFAADLDEQVAQATEELVEKVDSYLDYVIEQWMEQNEVAIESSIKVEVAESLLDSLKGLVEGHNLDVSDEQVDAIAELEKRLEEQEAKYNETVESMIALKESKETLEREVALSEISEGLTDTQADKLATLAEGISYDSTEEYKEKLVAIKESYFAESAAPVAETADETEMLEEEVQGEAPAKDPLVLDESVSRYAAALDRLSKR